MFCPERNEGRRALNAGCNASCPRSTDVGCPQPVSGSEAQVPSLTNAPSIIWHAVCVQVAVAVAAAHGERGLLPFISLSSVARARFKGVPERDVGQCRKLSHTFEPEPANVLPSRRRRSRSETPWEQSTWRR